jgi:hypothetical protein
MIFKGLILILDCFLTLLDLEFGQLSRLILMEDQDRVENFLRRYPSSMNEINYLGQTPVHIAVQTQNANILSSVVSHADPKLLNTKDNDGFHAIDYTIDALYHSLKPGKEPGSTVCNGCKVLNVLLRSESAIFTNSVRLAMQLPQYHSIPVCIEGQKNIIRSLASRRKELKTLAQRELTPAERQNLKFCEPGILDRNAAKTQRFLEAKKFQVPMCLKVYSNDESPGDSKSIYLSISHGDVAESALQSGFLMPITLFDDVFRSLAEWLGSGHSDLWRRQDFLFSSYICWLVDYGGDLRSTVPTPWGSTTAAHYFMAYLGTNQHSFDSGFIVPLSPEVSSAMFEEHNTDDCRCQCSPTGCTPLTTFLAAINYQQDWLSIYAVTRVLEDVLRHLKYLCNLLGHVGYDLNKEHWIASAAVRQSTFLILDLRHTCCFLGDGYKLNATSPLSTADRLEIEEEDSSRLELFEKLATEFERERGNYADFLSFARQYWAPRMEAVYGEIESYVLTETQRQEAEEAGVVWGYYGPQLPCDDSLTVDSEREEEISELEKLLRELDEIATDPARPSLV